VEAGLVKIQSVNEIGFDEKTHSVSGNGINFAYMYNKNAYMYVYSRRSSLYRPTFGNLDLLILRPLIR